MTFRLRPEAKFSDGTPITSADVVFSLETLRYEYPNEPVPSDKTPQQHLRDLTWLKAAERYPEGVPEKVRALLESVQSGAISPNDALHSLRDAKLAMMRWRMVQFFMGVPV